MFNKITLDNGLRLITSAMPHTRSVSIVFFIGTGACYEAEAEAGISHFVEHLCFKGTKKRQTTKEISEAIESIGGIINGGTDKEVTTYWCRVTSQHFLLALDVLVDLLLNSRFDAKDIDRERHVIIEEINMSLDSPSQRVSMLIDELLWPEQPLGRDVAGSKETVAAINRQQMLDFLPQHYLPNNTIVSIAGDIVQEQVQDVIKQSLGDWKPGKISDRFLSNSKQEAPRIRSEFRDSEQAHICLGIPGLSLFHRDRYAVDLLSTVLGEGMSSRLFTEVREQQGLAYDIQSYADHFTESGSIIVHAGVAPKQVGSALKSILEQLSQLKEGISEMELNRAKEMAKGRLLLSLENSRIVAAWLGAQEMLMNRIRTTDEVTCLVDAITREDLTRVAQQLITKEKLNLAIVGPVKEDKTLVELLRL